MSEMGEAPMPQPEQLHEPPRQRLEDMPEFQKLAPEQQEKLLALRERMMAESMSPQHVVTRSIDEMGFWEGMKATMKPHVAKAKEIAFKELKANASLALSLIPILGEAKGFGVGAGLFGITVDKAKTVAGGAIKFEPFVRLEKAGRYAKMGFNFSRARGAVDVLKTAESSGKSAGVLKTAGAHIHDTLQPLPAILAGKTAAERSLVKGFSNTAKEGAKIIAGRFGVEGIQAAQYAKNAAKVEAYKGVKTAVAAKNAASGEWYKFPLRWARSAGGEVRANVASIKKGWEKGADVTKAVNEAVKSKSTVGKFVEGGVKRAAPTAIEATKFGKFQAFFDRYLNLTPDVPFWISATTGTLEFLGAHAIDAIPAVMQIGINRFQQAKLSLAAAKDVALYTAGRVLKSTAERRSAAKTFATQPAMTPA